ncbi:chloride channel protein [Clostridium baratii]|uniref:ClC family H(+)/Cl(-) exchange transporter n=1 Tax=Clostridium baratii TaxID=1561 RepID=UPI00290608A0|nr:chloride channel protein [Clostridium baratii]MDU4910097.1 chloride channel protein [Clostridium baratii]
MNNESFKELIFVDNLRVRVVLESILVGLGAGFIVSLYRLLLKYIGDYSLKIYEFMYVHKLYIFLGLLFLMFIGYIVGRMVEKNPMISGSGIPQIEGSLKGYFNIKNPLKILINKFVGGVLAIGCGLSLGIEGPSIQLGASIGNIYSNITKKIKLEERYLISSGAGAGLAAAFNAPFAGVMFSLEEVNKDFSPLILLPTIAAAVSSDLVTWIFFGSEPILHVDKLKTIPVSYYILIVILGIIVGLGGVLYNNTLLKTQDLYKKLKVKLRIRMMIPFACAMIFGLFLPEVLGGGDPLINRILVNGMVLKFGIILLVCRFIYSMISFASDTPGGILFPLLTLGALVGVIFGHVAVNVLGIDSSFIINFVLLAMAGMFASIVRAPITGLILVCEMSGSISQLGPLATVCGTAYLVAESLKCEPVYTSLLKRRIASNTCEKEEVSGERRVVNYIVELGAPIVSKNIKNLKLINNALIASIERDGDTIIPNGETTIRPGDYLTVLVDKNYETILRAELEKLCESPD